MITTLMFQIGTALLAWGMFFVSYAIVSRCFGYSFRWSQAVRWATAIEVGAVVSLINLVIVLNLPVIKGITNGAAYHLFDFIMFCLCAWLTILFSYVAVAKCFRYQFRWVRAMLFSAGIIGLMIILIFVAARFI